MTELTGKQKRFLKGLGVQVKATISVGKAGVTDNTLVSVNNGFNTRELLKIKIQDGCSESKDEVAAKLAEGTGSDVVQIIGNTILLYRENPDHSKIILPD